MLERTLIYLFSLNKEANPSLLYYDQITGSQLSYNDFSNICEKVWSRLIITLSFINLKRDMIVVN